MSSQYERHGHAYSIYDDAAALDAAALYLACLCNNPDNRPVMLRRETPNFFASLRGSLRRDILDDGTILSYCNNLDRDYYNSNHTRVAHSNVQLEYGCCTSAIRINERTNVFNAIRNRVRLRMCVDKHVKQALIHMSVVGLNLPLSVCWNS